MLLSFVFLVLLCSSVRSANILACIPTPSHSHQIAFQDLWRQLSLRGHKVTLITTDPLDDPKLTNLTEIDLSYSYRYFDVITNLFETEESIWNYQSVLRELFFNVTPYALSHPQVQELVRGKGKFDVVLVEHLFPELLIFGKIYKCPSIVISSTDVDQVYYQALGNPVHPISHPHFYLPYHGAMTFPERLLSSIHYFYTYFHNKFDAEPFHEENLEKYFNISDVNLEDLIADIDVILINSHPIIHGPRALSPGTIFMAHFRPAKKAVAIDKELQEFMDNAKDGFVYFSLGSNVKINKLNQNLQDTIIGAIKEFPYKIVCKYNGEIFPQIPDHVIVVKWAPQKQVLKHPNIKLFVMQGGRQSTEEAIHAAVPMVIIPFFYDQNHNANVMKARGIAQVMHKSSMGKEDLKNAMIEVFSSPRYKAAAIELRRLALDVQKDGLDNAIWWTEYVIRNKGAKQLRNPVADLPLYQYFLVDVMGFLIMCSLIVSFLTYTIVKKLLVKVRCSLGNHKKVE